MNNQISVEIPQEVIENVMGQLKNVKRQLAPYLQGLTKKERKAIFKMGNKTASTVNKVKSYISTNPQFAPNYMDIEEFLKDEKVVEQLSPILDILQQLCSDTDDTVMLAGSEALSAAMFYYGGVNDAARNGIATAKPIYDDLKGRFSKRSKPKSTEE